MTSLGIPIAAFVFGVAVGFLNNAISGWAWRWAGREGHRRATPGWSSVFALQSVLRVLLSLASLYAVFRVSGAAWLAIGANLVGLLLPRYWLVWRLARGHGEGWL